MAPFIIHETDAIKVRGVTITSSPSFKSNAKSARSKATVPFETATAWVDPTKSANSFSNFLPSFPVQ